MQDINTIVLLLSIIVIVTFTVLSLLYPIEQAATDALSKRYWLSRVSDEYKCKQCGAIEDQKHIFLRSSGYCSLACEDPLSVICDKPDDEWDKNYPM